MSVGSLAKILSGFDLSHLPIIGGFTNASSDDEEELLHKLGTDQVNWNAAGLHDAYSGRRIICVGSHHIGGPIATTAMVGPYASIMQDPKEEEA